MTTSSEGQPLTLQAFREMTERDPEDATLRARTPHGSYVFDITGVTWDDQGRPVLHLQEDVDARPSKVLPVDSMGRPV